MIGKPCRLAAVFVSNIERAGLHDRSQASRGLRAKLQCRRHRRPSGTLQKRSSIMITHDYVYCKSPYEKHTRFVLAGGPCRHRDRSLARPGQGSRRRPGRSRRKSGAGGAPRAVARSHRARIRRARLRRHSVRSATSPAKNKRKLWPQPQSSAMAASIFWSTTPASVGALLMKRCPLDAWRKVLETNVIGTQLMTRAVLPAMRKQGYGKIVNIASIMGLIGVPKEILEAVELHRQQRSSDRCSLANWQCITRHKGIRVNALAPGFFPTRLSAGVVEHASDRIKAITPLGRLGRSRRDEGTRRLPGLRRVRLPHRTNHRSRRRNNRGVKELMRTRKEYIESLRDGREVYFKGQRVADVTEHPEIRLAIDHAAIDYDMAHDPAWRTLAVAGHPQPLFPTASHQPRPPRPQPPDRSRHHARRHARSADQRNRHRRALRAALRRA